MKTTFTFWVCFTLFFMMQTYGQVTISYTNAPLNPGNCNVFNTSNLAVIGGLTHYPVCGGITYNGKDAIRLLTVGGSTPSATTATAYGIGYTFKKGHTYNVQVTAAGSSLNGPSPTLYAGFYANLPNPAQTLPAVCGAVSHTAWSAVLTANAFNVPGKNVGVFDFTAFTPTSNLNVMTILAQSFKNGAADTVKISKIVIRDRITLPLSPASVTKNCGTALTQNFVVSNPNGVEGITAYNWNLGSANSGWLYNGAPAPQFLTTTSNVLTLTAAACSAPITNVTAEAVIDGVRIAATGTAAATNVSPTFSITGPSNVCTSATFSVTNLPCNATVAWSVWPQGVVNITPSGNTVTATSVFDYATTLTATVSAGCLATPVTLTKEIVAGAGVKATYTAGPNGPSTPTDLPTSPTPNYSSGGYITYWGTLNTTGLSNIAWSTAGDAPYNFSAGTGSFMYTERRSGALVYVVLDAVGPCGTIHKEYPFLSIITGGSLALNVAPNPARGSLTITTTAPGNEGTVAARTSKPAAASSLLPQHVYAVKITDINGKVVKHIENKSGATPLTVSLAGIRSGYYLLSAFDGKTWTTKSIVVNE